MLEIYFLRHGQTEFSRDNKFCGSATDAQLTPQGRAMGEAFAEFYRDTQWRAIYSSPLERTRITANTIASRLNQQPIVRDGLTEIGYGKWEARTVDEVDRLFHDDYLRWTADPAWYPPTEGESAISVSTRALEVVQEIRDDCHEGKVLVVSHKATIRIVLCALLGIDVGRFRYRLGCPVSSVSVVSFAGHGPLLEVLADRSHLPQELLQLEGT